MNPQDNENATRSEECRQNSNYTPLISSSHSTYFIILDPSLSHLLSNQLFVSTSSPLPEAQKSFSPSQINYSSIQDIQDHYACLEGSQQLLLGRALDENKSFKHMYTEEYYANAGLIIGAEPAFAVKFCSCGRGNFKNKSGRCTKRHFCPRCSDLKFTKHWDNLGGSFDEVTMFSNYYFVTLSWVENITITDNSWVEACHLHWDALEGALSTASKDKTIRGALVCEELSVHSFHPCTIKPHIHAIVHADYWDEETTEQLSLSISAATGVELTPDVQAKPLEKHGDFERTMRYMFKPMNIAKAYTAAWNTHYSGSRKEAWRLNSQLKDLLRGHVELTKGNVAEDEEHAAKSRMMIRCLGSMHGKSKDYVGKRKKKTKKAKKGAKWHTRQKTTALAPEFIEKAKKAKLPAVAMVVPEAQ